MSEYKDNASIGLGALAAAPQDLLNERKTPGGFRKKHFAWPVAVMSFGRPQLLGRVLRDLRNQTLGLADEQVYLFQDGNVDPYSGKRLIEDSVKNACIALFREAFPGGHVAAADTNLGIALNFDRAERTTLGPSGAEAAAFFEDDLALSEHYLQALGTLLDFALGEDLVSYVAAYGDHRATLDQQIAQPRRIVPMQHKWGFGLTRRQWQRQKPIIEPYLRLLEGKNYTSRDHAKIAAYFDSLGYRYAASSQDAAKDVAGYVLGTAKLMSYVCYGKYLGEVGVHQTAESYRKAGYAETVVFTTPPDGFDVPSKENLAALIMRQRLAFRTAGAPRPPAAPSTPPAPNLDKPHLFGGELEILTRIMGGHRRYQEFGMGGSTLLATRSGLDSIVAVESDPNWVGAVRGHPEIAAAIKSGRAEIRHGDIGPVGAWGNPKNRDQIQKWPGYIREAWDTWSRRGELPDLVFVDGRFRVACCLSVILATSADANLSERVRVVLHDVGPERPHYDDLLEFFDVVEQVNTLRVMKIKHPVAGGRLLSVFLRRQFDQQ